MSSNTSVTDQRHNDYVGTDANITRIPGASEATSGHHYEAVFPKEPLRAEEHLPPPTGRDRPPRHDVPAPDTTRGVGINDDVTPETNPFRNQGSGAGNQRETEDVNQPRVGDVYVDRDPYAEPTRASDTLTGATSADVHRGTGKPLWGETSTELHHDGQHHRKRDHVGAQARYGDGFVPKDESEIDRSRDITIADEVAHKHPYL